MESSLLILVEVPVAQVCLPVDALCKDKKDKKGNGGFFEVNHFLHIHKADPGL
jgi:hypothetical protein